MRGRVDPQQSMFVAFNLEAMVPQDHPLRPIKRWADRVLGAMSRDFDRAYGKTGRPSVPPERMLKALLLQSLYSIPSETKLVDAIQYNLLYRWFVDLPLEEDAWTQEAFSMNRGRFELHDLCRKFFDRVVAEGIERQLVSEDHFTVDGTLIRSMASQKSLEPIDGGDDDAPGGRDEMVDFHGQKRTNATHRSRTDPEARLARKGAGKEAHLSHSGHVLMENRSGLCLAVTVDTADGRAERRNALRMLRHVKKRHKLVPRTLGADAGYRAGEFLATVEVHGSAAHVPMDDRAIKRDTPEAEARRRARRRMKTVGYRLSQRVRKRVEQIIGWAKTTAGLARARHVGHVRIENAALMAGAAYNLLRMVKLRPT